MADQGTMFFPDATFRSPTAVQGKSDIRDDNVYSSIVMAHGGAGQQKVFTVPQGQTIPTLAGSGIAPTAAHQKTYTEVTTNLDKAGEVGSSIGDLAIRAIGITIEQAAVLPTTNAINSFGATPYEVGDILSKTFFELRVAGKRQTMAPTFSYPNFGGAYGSFATTGNNVALGVVSNGRPGTGRRLTAPILVARNDTLVGVVGVAGGASLAFSVTSGAGQSTLVWYNLLCSVKGDVR